MSAGVNYVNILIVFNEMPTFIVVHRQIYSGNSVLFKPTIWLVLYICSAEKDAFNLLGATAFMKIGQTRLLAVYLYSFYVLFLTLLSEVE